MSDWVALSIASLIVGAIFVAARVFAPMFARWYWQRMDERIAQQIRAERLREAETSHRACEGR